ncbi:magnesium chelatase subunit D [Skermanella mucosa]|uniref:magnesium chelatase subunit D n=1 Tax=Skermanella mucosa TaxID=1789672 RepID=UPI00192AE7A4|nr:magnesium chelatase subunit D [Skermanella mucosa]UEM22834.1 magnesium chelatase subunit D [Skermanella mucosa]
MTGWEDAAAAAALFAVDPAGFGGVTVRAAAGPVRDRWLDLLRGLLDDVAPFLRVPCHVTDDRLLGGLDLAATLRAGRPVVEQGILARSDGGIVLLAMAERLPPAMAARLAAVLDRGEVRLERDGFARNIDARFGLVALDEGDAEERPAAVLTERLAFHLDLGAIAVGQAGAPFRTVAEIAEARGRFARVRASDEVLEALCGTAAALGIGSIRAPLQALAAARAAAALEGRTEVGEADAALAARLVLAPRATCLPAPPEQEPEPERSQEPEKDSDPNSGNQEEPLEDVVLEAARAAIPEDLLKRLGSLANAGRRAQPAGKAGAVAQAAGGRPAGVRRGPARSGARLNVIETLRAAAPWQRLRADTPDSVSGTVSGTAPRIQVRPEDFRIARLKRRSRTTTIFVVDASGSSAFHRLAEAKGAVELLLADCYVRRDEVALVAFRGRTAELLLPPTRSLARAKRCLAALPGGGGTPLAAGIYAASALADAVTRRGGTPALVLLTDGRANICRDGSTGRAAAEGDALSAARQVAAAGLRALLVDTSAHPEPAARRIADGMRAPYLPLPRADAAAISRAVRMAAPQPAS